MLGRQVQWFQPQQVVGFLLLFFKGQGMTLMSEELLKIERPWECWCLYFSQELFYATELPGNVSSWGKEPQSLGSWKVSKKHCLPPLLQRWDSVPGAGQPNSES